MITKFGAADTAHKDVTLRERGSDTVSQFVTDREEGLKKYDLGLHLTLTIFGVQNPLRGCLDNSLLSCSLLIYLCGKDSGRLPALISPA